MHDPNSIPNAQHWIAPFGALDLLRKAVPDLLRKTVPAMRRPLVKLEEEEQARRGLPSCREDGLCECFSLHCHGFWLLLLGEANLRQNGRSFSCRIYSVIFLRPWLAANLLWCAVLHGKGP